MLALVLTARKTHEWFHFLAQVSDTLPTARLEKPVSTSDVQIGDQTYEEER